MTRISHVGIDAGLIARFQRLSENDRCKRFSLFCEEDQAIKHHNADLRCQFSASCMYHQVPLYPPDVFGHDHQYLASAVKLPLSCTSCKFCIWIMDGESKWILQTIWTLHQIVRWRNHQETRFARAPSRQQVVPESLALAVGDVSFKYPCTYRLRAMRLSKGPKVRS